MYDNEYEWDILLFLRILKYLHTSDADMVNAIIRDYPEVDEEDPDMIMYDLLWAFFDEEPEETDDEFYTVRFSDQSVDRLYQLGCQDGDIFFSQSRVWQEKIKDTFLFYVVGASHSVFDVAYYFGGDGVKIDISFAQKLSVARMKQMLPALFTPLRSRKRHSIQKTRKNLSMH